MDSEYLQTIDVNSLPFTLVESLTPEEQSNYKYIIHIEGHVSAFRLSYELSMNSVILLVKNDWKMWYSDILEEFVHYVPIKEDLSDLVDKIKWCRKNDKKCKEIAHNAKEFHNKYLQKDGIFDYLQNSLVNIKKHTGEYIYNTIKPLGVILEEELNFIKKTSLDYPNNKNQEPTQFPNIKKTYGYIKGINYALNKLNNFEKYTVFEKDIFTNKLGTIKKYDFLGFKLSLKTTIDETKKKEHIHETFVGASSINNIRKYIPNFAYIFGFYTNTNSGCDSHNVITEYIEGETLQEYIKRSDFSFERFILIILQLCLALQVAQQNCCFVHNDLTPWNIIIKELETPIYVEYKLSYKKIIRLKTDIIPVIIDYGKSHVIYDNKHHGFINMFKFSTSADIMTLLITSIYQIITEKLLPKNDFNNLLKLANFMSNTTYYNSTFINSKELKMFLHNAKKYSNLISEYRYELENKTPLNLFEYIRSNIRYKFDIEKTNSYSSHHEEGDPEQVYNYIFAKNDTERIETYSQAFNKIKYDLENFKVDKALHVYFISQTTIDRFYSLIKDYEVLSKNLGQTINKDREKCDKIIKDVNTSIHSFFNIIKKYKNLNKEKININLDGTPFLYNEDIFLVPEKIKKLLLNMNYKNNDISEYKEMLEYVLLNDKDFKLRIQDRKFYLSNMEDILNKDICELKTYNANCNTLKKLAESIYNKDIMYIEQRKNIKVKAFHDKLYYEVLDILKN
jgi:hypothetical protein